MRRLEAVELPNHGAAHMGIVLIDNTYRHLYRLSSVHQRSEKEHYYKGEDKGTEPEDRMPPHNDQFADKDVVDAFYGLREAHFFTFFTTNDIPGRRPSKGLMGRALTSKVLRSY